MNPSFSDSQIMQVDQLILHQYATSPFSEKIRAILSFKDVPWTAVEVPSIMPKPDLVALTGGYRRTPVLQIGAHIYCDTALIAEMLERLAPSPAIFPPESAGIARFFAQWADATLFWTAAAYVFQPEGAAAILGHLSPEERNRFAVDRMAFRGALPRMAAAEATASLLIYLRRFETMLIDGRVWLLGSSASIADFSVYHCLWFIRRAGPLGGIIDDFPYVAGWYERMRSLVQPPHAEMTSQAALHHAADEMPQELESEFYTDTHGIALGQQVTITPIDTGCDPVRGELVLALRDELAVRRYDERVGELIVHFPRLGFEMKKAA
ncbi:MAG: glutathione S-transferase family protein [Burkholderiaceae bacterium]